MNLVSIRKDAFILCLSTFLGKQDLIGPRTKLDRVQICMDPHYSEKLVSDQDPH
jgi:hypothetical protein